ncbi:5-formyltetrahydrofolate cyclo-ligase [Desulfobulbus alkaliphilus]|uniref:5-formyltetrahydrofolate cyclo-ligase n=1 Tax=Desulfobulbus alkaliphilus TaxID=869814 RepID=UPI001965B153|nr:5-formyltetrahydrofolate cyclo-ligase [Desulfobulbus alkaliphilus]MBM9536765.1 5-formyltetrahydrofolate cyclo-ligase [Desulfobulbus alkaliphilus]
MTDHRCMDRQELRTRFLTRRNVLSREQRDTMSARIAELVTGLPIFREKNHFFLYCSYQSEVDTMGLLQRCLQAGKIVSVPLTVPGHSRMLAVTVSDPGTDLALGYKGILEPMHHRAKDHVAALSDIDVAFVPGIVFDRCGHRLGYGRGYYDRFLAASPQAVRIGLAFALQLTEYIPAQSHDIPMDIVITEQEVLMVSQAEQ